MQKYEAHWRILNESWRLLATSAAKFTRHPVLSTNKDGIRKRGRLVGAEVVDFQEGRVRNGSCLSQTGTVTLHGCRVDYMTPLPRCGSVVLTGSRCRQLQCNSSSSGRFRMHQLMFYPHPYKYGGKRRYHQTLKRTFGWC